MIFFHSFLFFVLFIFVYIHVSSQYKKSQDLEIYELDYKNNSNLQEICDIRQPIIFHHPENTTTARSSSSPIINLEIIATMEKEDGNAINIFDIQDFYNPHHPPPPSTSSPVPTPLPFQSAMRLIKTDTNTRFFTENNETFVEDAGLDEWMNRTGIAFFKPPYTANQRFDIMTGTNGLGTPMRYHTNTRKYIHVSGGRIMVKMTPFKNKKKLDFNDEHVSSINCWNPMTDELSVINKIRFLEFQILTNHVLYIPPYWIYSIQYLEDNVCLLEYNYKTFMNEIAYPQKYAHIFTTELGLLQNATRRFFFANSVETDTTTVAEPRTKDEILPPPPSVVKDCDLGIISKKHEILLQA